MSPDQANTLRGLVATTTPSTSSTTSAGCPAGLRRLPAEGGGLEPAKGQETEHHPEEDVGGGGALGRGEHAHCERQVLGAAVADELDQHHGGGDEDQEDGPPLERQDHVGRLGRRHGGQRSGNDDGGSADQVGQPVGIAVDDAYGLEEQGPVDAGHDRGEQGEQDVGTGQAPGGAGPRAEGWRQPVRAPSRSGESAATAGEAVGDQQGADERYQERQRDGPSHRADGALRVDADGHRRGHQPDGQADHLPELQVSPEPGSLPRRAPLLVDCHGRPPSRCRLPGRIGFDCCISAHLRGRRRSKSGWMWS